MPLMLDAMECCSNFPQYYLQSEFAKVDASSVDPFCSSPNNINNG